MTFNGLLPLGIKNVCEIKKLNYNPRKADSFCGYFSLSKIPMKVQHIWGLKSKTYLTLVDGKTYNSVNLINRSVIIFIILK